MEKTINTAAPIKNPINDIMFFHPFLPLIFEPKINRIKDLYTLKPSDSMATSDGTKINKITIPKPRPKTRVITVGFKNCASLEFSKSRGAKPKTVVSVVNKIGLSLSTVATNIAFKLSILTRYIL